MPFSSALRRIACGAAFSSLAIVASASRADTVQVLTAGAFKQVVLAMVPGFEARTGHTVVVSNDTVGALAGRVSGGEPFDVLVMTPSALRTLADDGRVAGDTIRPLARVAIGVAVKAGAPQPPVGTVEQFRQALLQARSVAYIDPASGGSSGIYLDGLFRRLGIADQVRAKAVLVKGGLVAEKLVSGEAELAVHQISEILPVTGVELVGPIPEPVQNYTTYAGAVGTKALHREAGQAFLDTLSGGRTTAVLEEKGLYPPN
ncbi:substrate-binding domain-containing protein [Xylophilus sp. GOD-11R]|uniref:molybdate ABC transporter substrate-binding protein n=1 Tax=Xylophilus sp. GOD-11R TaxID=3089814 RepID=UPI00298CF5B6|nr:substrate-binding domain-containing protein [Xylophilus sp. GOD-11R]WPB56673.1 substrate-binding domain-containing protein [Xylophilus sp. GOD-11R]